jgi:DNA polymerase-3 subunit epsilon
MMDDATPLLTAAQDRMSELALHERFEEATDLRNRISSLVSGVARGQRIRALSRIPELVTALPRENSWEICVIKFGRLAGSALSTKIKLPEVISSLRLTSEVVEEGPGILPASSHEEVEALLRYLEDPNIRLVHLDGQWTLPMRSGAALRERLVSARKKGEQSRYKDRFANSLESSDQRSRS